MDGFSLMRFQGGRMACTQPGAPGPAPKGRGQTANGRQCTRMGKGCPQMAQMTGDGEGNPRMRGWALGNHPPGIPKGFCHKAHGCTAEVLPWVNVR